MARDSDAADNYNPNAFSAETATTAEVERINALQPSKSPVLNEASREDINAAVRLYNDEASRLNDLIGTNMDNVKKDVDANVEKQFEDLAAAIPACKQEVIANIQHYVLGSHGYLIGLLAIIHGGGIQQFNSGRAADSDPVADLNVFDANLLCSKYSTRDKLARLKKDYSKVLSDEEDQIRADQKQAKDMLPRISRIVEAWNNYKGTLEKAIEDNASPGIRVADHLPTIIAVFCLFAICIFLTVRMFGESVQFELVASGQVIQFATVMVILIVVCVLGISGTLHENTLGTLLGGIGGYVLSQGVGRAATRAANQAAQYSWGASASEETPASNLPGAIVSTKAPADKSAAGAEAPPPKT